MARQRPNPSRFFGLALGRYDNFNARTDGLIGLGDTTPSVELWSLLYANTNGNLNITYFDNPSEGQIVYLMNLGAGEVQFSGNQMKVADSSDLYANSNISFIHHNSSWYELSRSHTNQKNVYDVPITAGALDATPSVAGNVKVLIFDSAGNLVVTDFDDGHEGQQITCINRGAGSVAFDHDVTKIMICSSAQDLVLAGSAACTFTNVEGVWFLSSVASPAAVGV